MATKRIKDLTTTATEADLVAGNYIAIDGSAGTKKLLANTIPACKVKDRGYATVATIAALSFKQLGWKYIVTDSGTLNNGGLSVVAGDIVVYYSGKWNLFNEASRTFVSNFVNRHLCRKFSNVGMQGYYSIAGGVATLTDSANWVTQIVPVEGLATIKTFAGQDGNVPCIIWVDNTGAIISVDYGRNESDVANIYEFSDIVNPPNGAVNAIINCYAYKSSSLSVAYTDNDIFPLVKKVFKSSGQRMAITNNVVSVVSAANWDLNIFPVERLRKVRTASAVITGTSVPVAFFKGDEITTANLISFIRNPSGVDNLCDIEFEVPAGATFVAVNVLSASLDSNCGAYYERLSNDEEYVVDVGGNGDFTSVADAVESLPSGSTIRVMPGIYEGCVRSWTKRMNIIGVDKKSCILVSYDGRYDNPALEIAAGLVKNLTILSKYDAGKTQWTSEDSRAYAVHVENQQGNESLAEGSYLSFENCLIASDFNPAIGCGTFVDWELRIENCELVNSAQDDICPPRYAGSLGAFYVHSQNGANLGNGNVVLKNNILRTKNYGYALCMYDLKSAGKTLTFTFIGNCLVSTNGQTTGNIWWRGEATPFGDTLSKNPDCWNNTNAQLDS